MLQDWGLERLPMAHAPGSANDLFVRAGQGDARPDAHHVARLRARWDHGGRDAVHQLVSEDGGWWHRALPEGLRRQAHNNTDAILTRLLEGMPEELDLIMPGRKRSE